MPRTHRNRQRSGPATSPQPRQRPGSVLVLVIVLLVLMALIGTAWITSTRADSYAARQNTYNTQIELLVQGVRNLIASKLTADLYGDVGAPPQRELRPPEPLGGTAFVPPPPIPFTGSPPAEPVGYEHFDHPMWDHLLADRMPGIDLDNDPATPPALAWRSISGSPVFGFEAPYAVLPNRNPLPLPETPPSFYNQRHNVVPDFIDVPSAAGGARRYPALRLFDVNGNERIVLAADTDGDGIADAGLWRLPVGQIEGVTYYGACRAVDNNSAINASVALQSSTLPPPPNDLPGDFFPTNINLFGMVPVAAEFDRFTAYRGGAAQPSDVTGAFFTAVDDRNGARTDFVFVSRQDAFWQMLGRRLDNPGLNGLGSRYRALPISESMALARNFVVSDPSSSPSLLEQYLPSAMRAVDPANTSAAANPRISARRYAPDDINNWFQFNFRFDALLAPPGFTPSRAPLRPITVARNPVSNFVPNKFSFKGPWINGGVDYPYVYGDWVQHQLNPASPLRSYVCVRPTLSVPKENRVPGTDAAMGVWVPMNWLSHPTKTSANTANFGQLWLAYWSTMADRLGPPAGPPTVPPASSLYGTPFNRPGVASDLRHRRMFRSSLRNPGYTGRYPAVLDASDANGAAFLNPSTPQLTPNQMLQLRAALAAVNTIDMRDADNDVTSRRVLLFDGTNDPAYQAIDATVYGTEKQPFITEVILNNDNDPDPANPARAYIAVELYNPHPVPIPLAGWRFAFINRAAAGSGFPNLTYLPTGTVTDLGTAFPSIPALSSVVLEFGTRPVDMQAAMAALDATRVKLVPDLVNAFDHEMVLLRPRRADGLLSRSRPPDPTTAGAVDAFNAFDENGPNLSELVPVDQMDFTGIPATSAATDQQNHRYRYARGSDITAVAGKAWHCVYPGQYWPGGADNVAITGAPATSVVGLRHGGIVERVAAGPTLGFDGAFLGSPEGSAANPATYFTRPIQLNNWDFGGPLKPGLATNNAFPFGGFARNGDILQVPFVGAYRLRLPGQAAGAFLEMNSVTMDSAFADDADNTAVAGGADDLDPVTGLTLEQVGRFCPIWIPGVIDDYNPFPDPAGAGFDSHRYPFATRLFDYLTVQSPQDDYLPETDPSANEGILRPAPPNLNNAPYFLVDPPPATAYKYPHTGTLVPEAVPNQVAGRANDSLRELFNGEDTASVEGLVNINTAPWPVLAAVPFLPPGPTYAGGDANNNGFPDRIEAIAQSIVYYRDVDGDPVTPGLQPPHGPFHSLMELNKVPIFNVAGVPNGTLFQDLIAVLSGAGPALDADDFLGDLSPLDPTRPPGTPTTDQVFGDFETRFLMLTRVSNLLTTRSDSFTVYILVQGWRNVGDPNVAPELVVQRRVAFIADRSVVTPTNTSMSITNIPTD